MKAEQLSIEVMLSCEKHLVEFYSEVSASVSPFSYIFFRTDECFGWRAILHEQQFKWERHRALTDNKRISVQLLLTEQTVRLD